MQEHFLRPLLNVKFFIAAKLKGLGLYKVPPGSQWKAIFSVSLVCRSKFRRMDCSLNWNFINYGELCCDSFMIWWLLQLVRLFKRAAEISSFCRSRSAGSRIATSLCAGNFINTFVEHRSYRGFLYSSEWQKRPTIEKCWYNLSNLTNQRVYQELVYWNKPLKEMITGSAVLAWVQAPPS